MLRACDDTGSARDDHAEQVIQYVIGAAIYGFVANGSQLINRA